MHRFILVLLMILGVAFNCFSDSTNIEKASENSATTGIMMSPVSSQTNPPLPNSATKSTLLGQEPLETNRDLPSTQITIMSRKDRDYLSRVSGRTFKNRDDIVLSHHTASNVDAKYRYEILCNDTVVWESSLKVPANELETMFVRVDHNDQLDSVTSAVRTVQRGYYDVTPWKSIPPLFKENGLPKKMKNWFAWESGASIAFTRQHNYNFNKIAGDTTEVFVDLGKPVVFDHQLDMSYTHRFNKIWVGVGLERSWQLSKRFDTLYVERGKWFSRMGWNLDLAVPGFRYRLYRDPGIIPYYGRYEDSLYTKLYPGAKYEFLKRLELTRDSVLIQVEKPSINGNGQLTTAYDTISANRLKPLRGLAHEITLKAGYFQYSMNIHPVAYIAPIHTIGMVDMPFFKGDWDMKMIILPNGKIIPHGSIDFYRTSIQLGKYDLGISPFQFDVELWDRLGFYTSIGFNAELLTKKASFDKE